MWRHVPHFSCLAGSRTPHRSWCGRWWPAGMRSPARATTIVTSAASHGRPSGRTRSARGGSRARYRVAGCSAIGLAQQWLRPARSLGARGSGRVGLRVRLQRSAGVPHLRRRALAAVPPPDHGRRASLPRGAALLDPAVRDATFPSRAATTSASSRTAWCGARSRIGIAHYPAPFVMYFHTWELDPDQPRINGVPLRQQVRQYRNLRKMPALVRTISSATGSPASREYFELGSDPASRRSAGRAVGLRRPSARGGRATAPARRPGSTAGDASSSPATTSSSPSPISPIRSRSVVERAGPTGIDFSFVFVDDCSTDLTWQTLQSDLRRASRAARLRSARPQPGGRRGHPDRDSARRRPTSSARWTATAPTIPMSSVG